MELTSIVFRNIFHPPAHGEGGMRSPDASLIRARAKAPLPDLLALHLSSSDIECIKHLELCKRLQSLYADDNHIKDLEGIIELRKLWRIDLNGNLLQNLSALTSFRALGFLYLERNRICFDDLVCLRDQHLLEMRLLGNAELLKGNNIDEYRKKVVALLPNMWILDGHFISTPERQQAVEEFDPFVISLLEQSNKAAVNCSKFGSATDLWVDSEINAHDITDSTNSAKLIQIAHKRPHPNEPTDLKRLRAIISFHNTESVIHNTHCHFTPSKHNPNARQMPRIWLDEILALPRRTRLEMIILLATFLEFRYPEVLLTEAMTIQQLDSPNFPSDAIRDTANLPSYALVALIAVARHYSEDEGQAMRDRRLPEIATPEFEDESAILGTIPPLFNTLLSTPATSGDDQAVDATPNRCRRAIKLLFNVASFPSDPDVMACNGKGKRGAILQELIPLLRAAESASTNPAIPSGQKVIVPCFAIPKCKTAEPNSTFAKDPSLVRKRNATAQNRAKSRDTNFIGSLSAGETASGGAARRRPRTGDWMEISAKQFVRIQFLSDDGQFIVGAVPTDSSRTITIALEQLSRTSSSVWRVNHLTQRQHEELTAQNTVPENARLGKLHRDSESFHRHGAARNQGFPNHFVTSEVLKDLDRELPYTSEGSNHSVSKAIEIFSSNDTIDANYVLASPQLISAQNYCALNAFHQQRRAPAGLWSPVKQPAPYSVLTTVTQPSLGTSASLKDFKAWKPQTPQKSVCKPQTSKQSDDWTEIRREMQAQLGIVSNSASNERPLSSSMTVTSRASEYNVEPPIDSTSSLTIPAEVDSTASTTGVQYAALQATKEVSDQVNRRLSQQISNCRQVGANAKLVGVHGWHQVATKTEFVVSASVSLGASHSAPILRQLAPPKTTWEPRTPLKLHGTVMLPSLNKR